MIHECNSTPPVTGFDLRTFIVKFKIIINFDLLKMLTLQGQNFNP